MSSTAIRRPAAGAANSGPQGAGPGGSGSGPRAPGLRLAPAPILAVASGKGGVGKTWMSTTLACAFAAMGKRTLLVDGDLGLANVDVQLGINPQADIPSVIAGWIELEDAVCAVGGGAGRQGGFDVLPGRAGSGALAQLHPDQVHQLSAGIVSLAARYDQVIVDLAAGVDLNVMHLAKAADQLLMVVTDEPTSLTDAYAFIKVFRGHAPQSVPWVAVNMADKRSSGRRTYDTIAGVCYNYLGFRPGIAGIVTRDPRVPDSIRAHTPLPMRHPQAEAYEEVRRIADALSQASDPGARP